MYTLIKINCDYCGREFERSLGWVNQNRKRGRKNYCSKCRYKALSERMAGKNNPFYDDHRFADKNHPMYNKKHSRITRERMGAAQKRRFKNPLERKRLRESHIGLQIGENNPNWKGGVSSENEKERGSSKSRRFKQDMLKRDNYTCQTCGKHGGDLIVDHIMPWSLYPKLRQNPKNVRTLCKPCHKEYGAQPHYKPPKWATSSM